MCFTDIHRIIGDNVSCACYNLQHVDLVSLFGLEMQVMFSSLFSPILKLSMVDFIFEGVSMILVALAKEAGLPDGVLNIVHGTHVSFVYQDRLFLCPSYEYFPKF